MLRSEDDGTPGAMLQLILAYRRRRTAAAVEPESPPEPRAPARRGLPVVLLLLMAAVVSAYVGAGRGSGAKALPPPSVSPAAPASDATTPRPPGVSHAQEPSHPLAGAPAVAPAPAGAAVTPLLYRVQTGAFRVRAYAQDLVDQLRARDYRAAIVDVRTGPPHRVWITGAFDRTSGDRLVERLRHDGFDAILVEPSRLGVGGGTP
jgi:cell division septation protein DedD